MKALHAAAIEIREVINDECLPVHECTKADFATRKGYIADCAATILTEFCDWDDNRINDISYDMGKVFMESDDATTEDVIGHLFDAMTKVWY